MNEKENKKTGLKRKVLHSWRLRMLFIGIPLALVFMAVQKIFPPDKAVSIQLGIYSVAIAFLMYNFRKSDAANITISEQNEEINKQKQQLDKAYQELHEKNKEIVDSIRYARRIQQSLLPNENYIAKQLNKRTKIS